MSKKRIIILIVCFSIISISFAALNVKANTPSGMSLSYNSTNDILNATITHNIGSDNPNSHYIDFVRIKVNGSEVLNQSYTSQPSSTTFTYSYSVIANIGATIEVFARCSIVGSITRTLNVDDGTSTTNGENGLEISGYFGIWMIIGFSLIAVLILVRRRIKGS